MAQTTAPQIDTVKGPADPLMADMLLPYPSNTPFGNLALAEEDLLIRIDYTNSRLQRLYARYDSWTRNRGGLVPPEVLWLRLEIEEIVYWVRRAADTLIVMSCVIGGKRQTGSYARTIELDSIGRLLGRLAQPGPHPPHVTLFSKHEGFLRLLNDVSNACKHHFINHETVSIIGAEGPTAYYFPTDPKDGTGAPNLAGVRVSELVSSFRGLYAGVRKAHRDWLEGPRGT